jgi:SHS2 domain-containing protein
MSDPARGHRRVPHTADVILEAWAGDLAGCLEEAVAALASTYGDVDRAVPGPGPVLWVGPGPAEDQLLDLLDEVVFVLDTAEDVPVGARITARGDGAHEVVLQMVPRDRLISVGALPKAVARSELSVDRTPHRVACRFLVDV